MITVLYIMHFVQLLILKNLEKKFKKGIPNKKYFNYCIINIKLLYPRFKCKQ